MNTTDEIMALAEEYACAARTVTELNYEKWHSDTARTAKLREQVSARQALRAAIVELVAQSNWVHHPTALLTEADAAADLAGLPRPGAEPVFWYRPRLDGLYDRPIHNSDIERVRKESGDWAPLFAAPPQASQPNRFRFPFRECEDSQSDQAPQASQPLTDEQIEAIITNHNYRIHGDRPRYIARATEAAHGIGAAHQVESLCAGRTHASNEIATNRLICFINTPRSK